jgi:selenide,water dikinase
MGPGALAQVLQPLRGMFPESRFPELLTGLAEDAAVYRVGEDCAVIQTVDFFPPVVDDPYDFGAVAAANAMSDVYAMGGEVRLALNLCGFPEDLPQEVARAILRGGADKVAEAGGVLAGGHTVTDAELKYGLSVMGLVHPARLWTKAGARPGDRLVLTKPLGTGLTTTALKRKLVDSQRIADSIESMKRLNRRAAELLAESAPRSGSPVHACTDVTGFSLLGHALEMSEAGGVALSLEWESLPWVSGARELAAGGLSFPGGTDRNRAFYAGRVRFAGFLVESERQALFTPETSGGLLAALPAEELPAVTERFVREGQGLWVIGEVLAGAGIQVRAGRAPDR